MFKMDSWTTGLGASLPATTSYMFHAYDILPLVKGLSAQQRRLPANGISLTQALHYGWITYYLFSLLYVEPHSLGLTTDKFRHTLLGSRLWDCSLIPSQPDFTEAWPLSPQICSYYWILSLTNLLAVFHDWAMLHQFATDQGFQDGHSGDGYPILLVHNTVTSKNGLRQQSLQRRLARYEEEEEQQWEDSIHSLSQWSLIGLECHFDAMPSAKPAQLPEAFWHPLVTFLNQASIQTVLLPSKQLRKLTPHAKWD
jgi:hypothetical protein